MNQTVSFVKVALGGLWCRMRGETQPPVRGDESRLAFEREYDAILLEIAASVEATNAARRRAARDL